MRPNMVSYGSILLKLGDYVAVVPKQGFKILHIISASNIEINKMINVDVTDIMFASKEYK